MLDGQIERRMRATILTVGSFLYTAWVDGGQPDLDNIDNIDIEVFQQEIKQELDIQPEKDLGVREHDN